MLPLPLGEGWGEGSQSAAQARSTLTLTLSRGERGLHVSRSRGAGSLTGVYVQQRRRVLDVPSWAAEGGRIGRVRRMSRRASGVTRKVQEM